MWEGDLLLNFEDLNDLVEKQGPLVYGFCLRLSANRDDADDLYQETFLKTMSLFNKIDSNRNPRAFLISIAVNLWKDKCRKQARRRMIAPERELVESDADGRVEGPEASVITSSRNEFIRKIVDELPSQLRLPVVMMYASQMSVEEIARALGVPQGTVKSRLHRARGVIGEKLKEFGYDY